MNILRGEICSRTLLSFLREMKAFKLNRKQSLITQMAYHTRQP